MPEGAVRSTCRTIRVQLTRHFDQFTWITNTNYPLFRHLSSKRIGRMKNWLSIILLFPAFFAEAQITFRSLEDALQYADQHAVPIKSGQIGEQIARLEVREAQSNRLPVIGASLGYTDNITLQPALVPAQFFNPTAPEGELQELTFGTKYQYQRTLQVSWDIVNVQKKFATQRAKMGVEEATQQKQVNRINTYNQLANTYYSILLTQESIRIYAENLEVSQTLLEQATGKYQEGVLSRAEVNQTEIKHRQNTMVLERAKNSLEQLYIQLQSQLNTTESIRITDSPDQFVLESRAINTPHPEVIWEEKKLDVYEATLKQQKSSRWPTLSLVYQNNKIWATNEFMGFSSAIDQPQQFFGAQINFANMFNFSTKPKVEQTKKQIALQGLILENTRKTKNHEDELLQLQWDKALVQLNEARKILTLQEENDTHAANRYERGISSLDQRLNQYEYLLQAQDQYLQSLADFSLAQYQLFIRQYNF